MRNTAEVSKDMNDLPCISLIMPFEPKMNFKSELAYKLSIAVSKIENELQKDYQEGKYLPVLKKLQKVIKELNYNTHKKSIAIFVSHLIEKVYYLEMPVERKIFIGDSFNIRNVINSKKEIHKYLVVVLSHQFTQIYLGNKEKFAAILANVPEKLKVPGSGVEKIVFANDTRRQEEILLDQFLKYIDNGLSLLLPTHQFPLFIMGKEKIIDRFKTITQNKEKVLEYIVGHFEEKTGTELHKLMEPYVSDWKKIIQTDLLRQIDGARRNKKLSTGIKEVRKAALHKEPRMLVIEKDFVDPIQESCWLGTSFKKEQVRKNVFSTNDTVDEVIEKVLDNGGNVEFVENGLLKDYHKIALIENYSLI